MPRFHFQRMILCFNGKRMINIKFLIFVRILRSIIKNFLLGLNQIILSNLKIFLQKLHTRNNTDPNFY